MDKTIIWDENRGTGRTTKQMLAAPKGAVYIWPNSHLYYPKHLAIDLGRADLIIRGAEVFDTNFFFLGGHFSGLILDHAVTLFGKRANNYRWIARMINVEVKNKARVVKKYKVEMTFTISYIMNPKNYPEGSSPEECLGMDIAKFKAAPELSMEYNDIKVKGRIINVIA